MSDTARTRPGTGADHPFLAFLNTVTDDGKTRHDNSFSDREGLCAHLRQAGLDLPPDAAQHIALPPLLTFREAAYGALSAQAAKRIPDPTDMQIVEATLKRALAQAAFRLDHSGFTLDAHHAGGVTDQLALHFLDLASGPDFGRLKECARCTKLFLDHGRGRGRRWCDMATCGNRAKAESFRARKRAVATQ